MHRYSGSGFWGIELNTMSDCVRAFLPAASIKLSKRMSRAHLHLSRIADVAHRVVNGTLVFGTLAMIGGLGYGAYSLYVLRPAYLNSIRDELEEKAAAKHGISVEEVR